MYKVNVNWMSNAMKHKLYVENIKILKDKQQKMVKMMGLPPDDLKQFLEESDSAFQKQTAFTLEKIQDIELKSLMKNYLVQKMIQKFAKISDQLVGNLMIHKGIDWSDWDQFPNEVKNMR